MTDHQLARAIVTTHLSPFRACYFLANLVKLDTRLENRKEKHFASESSATFWKVEEQIESRDNNCESQNSHSAKTPETLETQNDGTLPTVSRVEKIDEYAKINKCTEE